MKIENNKITDLALMHKILNKALESAYKQGKIKYIERKVENNLVTLQPPFDKDKLICIHAYCRGIGYGTYFRVKERSEALHKDSFYKFWIQVVYNSSFEKLSKEQSDITNYNTITN